MTTDWKAVLAVHADYARKKLLHVGELAPLAVVHSSDGNVVWMPLPFSDADDRQIAWLTVRMASLAYDAIAIAVIVEAWTRKVERRIGESDAETVARISEAEDRIEVISIQLCYREAERIRWLVTMDEIVRDGDGRPIAFNAVEHEDEPREVGGAIGALLHDFHPTAEQQRAARGLLEMICAIEKIKLT
jgi:hypothetical protein